MLRIRLQRLGRKRQPTYRFIVSDRIHDTQYGSIEILGHYNPAANPKIFSVNAERVKHWISVGAQPSETVNNLFVTHGIIEGKKQKSVAISNKRKKKLAEKAQKA